MSTRGMSSAAFLNKLWKLVNDPYTDDLIRWSPKGRSFIITDQTRFTQELVPKYFKHNNIQSFIRQLNLYGFRKISNIDSGGLSPDRGEIEFFHSNFIRGEKHLLDQIKRKSQNSRGVAASEGNSNLNNILMELQKVKMNQESMKHQMSELKKENDMLWRQYSHVRMKFSKQQTVIEKLVRFMLTMMDRRKELAKKMLEFPLEGETDSSSAGHLNALKLKYEPKALLSITGPEEPAGPVIHEVTHMDESEDSSALLDKIFPSYSDSISEISNPLNESDMFSENIQRMDNVRNLKLEPVEAYLLDELEEGEFQNNSDVPSSFIITNSPQEDIATTVDSTTGSKMGQNYNIVFSNVNDISNSDSSQPIQLMTANYLPSNTLPNTGTVTIQSPNGTILENPSPPSSPGIMQMVNPSEINPNIIVNFPKEQLQNEQLQQQQSSNIFKKPSSSLYSSSNIGSKVVSNKRMNNKNQSGKLHLGNSSAINHPKPRRYKTETSVYNDKLNKVSNIYNLRNGSIGDTNQDNYEDLLKLNKSVSYSSPKEKKFGNKSEGKLMKQNYTVLPSPRQRAIKAQPEANILTNSNNVFTTNSDSSNLNNQDNNSDNFKVSLASRSISREDLENLETHVSKVDNTIDHSLDSLKELLQANNLSFDSSTLLSLFNNEEDSFIPMPEVDPSPSGVQGNEVSVYNPYNFDDETEGINFSSLIEDEDEEIYDSPSKKQKPSLIDKEEGFETPQPHQMEFSFRNG